MKLAAGMALGVTVMIVWHVVGWPFIGWVFTRIPPGTHPDCKPRQRVWHQSEEITTEETSWPPRLPHS